MKDAGMLGNSVARTCNDNKPANAFPVLAGHFNAHLSYLCDNIHNARIF